MILQLNCQLKLISYHSPQSQQYSLFRIVQFHHLVLIHKILTFNIFPKNFKLQSLKLVSILLTIEMESLIVANIQKSQISLLVNNIIETGGKLQDPALMNIRKMIFIRFYKIKLLYLVLLLSFSFSYFGIIISQFKKIKMEPKAILVLYEPGFKLKNSKYLLASGPNIVGRDSKCQVYIDSEQYFTQEYVANFFINDDFLYIQALCDNMVQLKSNINQNQSIGSKKKEAFKFIQRSTRYVLPIQEIFYIGPYKAIVQVQSGEQLLKINNVINIQNFLTPGKNQADNFSERNSSRMNSSRMSNLTQKIQSQNQIQYEPTLVMNDYDPIMYEPTIDLSQKYSQNLDIINNESLLKVPNAPKSPCLSQNNSKGQGQMSQVSQISNKPSHRGKQFSQEILLNSIRRQEDVLKQQLKNQANQQDEFSMPDTIRDQQFIDSNKNNSRGCLNNQNQQQDLDDQMPATIRDHEEIPIPTKAKHSQSMAQQERKPKSQKMFKSQNYKLGWDTGNVQNMFDLFGDVQYTNQKQKDQPNKPFLKKQICKADYSQIDRRVLIVNKIQSLNQKKLQLTPNQKGKFNEKEEYLQEDRTVSAKKKVFQQSQIKGRKVVLKQKQRFYSLLGFKPSVQQRLILKKRGLQLVNNYLEDYQILIIGKSINPNTKFLLAIMKGKIILTQNWIYLDNWKDYLQNNLKQHILGVDWEKIQRQKQDKWHIFDGNFYLTKDLKQYEQVLKFGGATIVDKLDHRKSINVILQPQSKQDKILYLQKKNTKRWKFYQDKIIAESVMIGQFIDKKYLVDDQTF